MTRAESQYLARVARLGCDDEKFWIPVCGWEGLYEVSQIGDVRRIGGSILKPIAHKRTGYLVVNLTNGSLRSQLLLHRVVLSSFVSKLYDSDECCHGDGNRHNCMLVNLRWDTRVGNHADKKQHGTHQAGSKHPLSRLTEEQAAICKTSREPIKALAERFGVSIGCVSKVRYGQTWRHLDQV